MGPGTSYTVSTYSPHPSDHELATAGRDYPAGPLGPYLTLQLPVGAASVGGAAVPITFPVFHTHKRPQVPLANDTVPHGVLAPPKASVATDTISLSPYAQAYALAHRLAAKAHTPYAFVMACATGSARPTASPTPRPRPGTRSRSRASCSPTRRATASSSPARWRCSCGWAASRPASPPASPRGRTTRTSGSWIVTDIDAHAWVEAWFPVYGWVRFDPTPSTAPARGGTAIEPILKKLPRRLHRRRRRPGAP